MNGPTLVHYLLLIVALVCFFLAAIRYREPGPIAVGWLGLAFWMLDVLIFNSVPK